MLFISFNLFIALPKNKQKRYYSGKKKRHTIKTQVVADKKSGIVICTNFAVGKRHDFRLFKESNLKISNKTKVFADTGFQGIKEIHENSEIPQKKSKKQKLTLSDKLENRRISSLRVKIENIIGFIKRFKIG